METKYFDPSDSDNVKKKLALNLLVLEISKLVSNNKYKKLFQSYNVSNIQPYIREFDENLSYEENTKLAYNEHKVTFFLQSGDIALWFNDFELIDITPSNSLSQSKKQIDLNFRKDNVLLMASKINEKLNEIGIKFFDKEYLKDLQTYQREKLLDHYSKIKEESKSKDDNLDFSLLSKR